MRQALLKYLPLFIRQQISNPTAQKVLGNTGWLFADKILRAIGELTIGIWLARYLGPEKLGTLSFAIAFVALFAPLYTLGLDKIVVRDIVQHPEQTQQILGSALVLRIITGVLGATAATSLIVWLRPSQPILQSLVGLMAFGLISQASDVITFWFQSQMQAKHDIWARSSAYGLISFARIGCVLTQASLITIGVTYVLEPIIRTIGLGMVYWKIQGFTEKWQFNLQKAINLLQHSWPLALSGVAIIIYMRIDQVMLGQLASDKAVGIYSAAVRLSEGWYFIPVAIASSVFPVILATKQHSESQYYSQLSKLFKLVVVLAYLIALPISFSSLQLVSVLFGPSYTSAAGVLSIYIWSGVFVSLGVIKDLWLTAENLLIFTFLTKASGAILNIVMNYILIPKYEAMGAAIATLISYMAANLLACLVHSKTRPIAKMMLQSIILI